MSDLFKTPTQQGTAQQLADSIPQGRAWGSKNVEESNTRKLVNSLGVAYNRTQQQIELLSDEFNILQTVELLTDWEESVGLLSDECLGDPGTLEQRREAVVQRFKKDPIVKLSEFQDFLDKLFPGLGLIVIPGREYYPLEASLEMPLLGAVDERFILVVTVPVSGKALEYDLEMDIEGGPDTVQLECILRKITPANVLPLIETVGSI